MKREQDPLIRQYAQNIKNLLGNSLKELWLFGSRARGDYSTDSDYDVLIVADADRLRVGSVVRDENYRMMEEHSSLFASIIYTPDIWKLASAGPLGMNVLRSGIRLL